MAYYCNKCRNKVPKSEVAVKGKYQYTKVGYMCTCICKNCMLSKVLKYNKGNDDQPASEELSALFESWIYDRLNGKDSDEKFIILAERLGVDISADSRYNKNIK